MPVPVIRRRENNHLSSWTARVHLFLQLTLPPDLLQWLGTPRRGQLHSFIKNTSGERRNTHRRLYSTLLYFSKLAYTSITRNSGHEPLNFFSCSRYHVNFYPWITWSWSVFIACKTDDNNLLICHSLSLSSYQHKHHLETAMSLLLSINLGTVDIITTFLYCLRQQLWEFGDYPCYHTQDGASLPVSAH